MKENFLKRFIHAGRIVIGILLLVIGIVGLFLPFLQGFLFIILAGVVLGKDSFLGKWIYRLKDYVMKKKNTKSN